MHPQTDHDAAPHPQVLAQVLKALDHIPTGLAVQDEHGDVLFANRVFRDLHGGTPPHPHRTEHHAAEHHGNAWRHSSGRWLMVHQTPVADGRTVAVYTDITDIKADVDALHHAKVQAENSARNTSQFLAAMSHELRTPLNAIIGFSEAILHGLLGPLDHGRYQEYARDVLNSGQHLLSLINDVLDLSKIEAGAMIIKHQPLALADVVDRALRMTREAAQANGLTLAVKLPADLPRIEGDDRRLVQVVLNLLSNAVKFTPEGGTIAITAAFDPQSVTLRVRDSGIGIAAEDIPRTLETFGQIDSPRSRRFSGSGLGLPLSRKLVELHGGSLTIDSTIGTGTTVTVHLPRVTPDTATE